MRNSIKNITLAAVALGALSLTACMSGGSTAPSDENATIFVRGKMNNVNTLSKPGLAKLTPITLATLRITAVSDKVGVKVLGEDSVVVEFSVGDTLTEDDDTLSHVATDDQIFDVELSLRPLRSWTIKVETIDDEDDVIQSGTSNLGTLFAGQFKSVNVTAGALYNNYTATYNFADSITSSTGTISRQDMKVTAITMQIGGDSAFDTASVRANGMTVDTDHLLHIYKVDTALASSDQDSVYLNVYGFLPQGPANGGTAAAPIKLYSKTKALDELDLNTPTTVTLDWVGPTTGIAGMNITISKVGTIEIDVEIPPVVID
jgi:hypothetical protein